jgi:hypothetical protein
MFLGFFIGTLCLLGLVRTVMGRGHHYAGYGWGPRYGGSSWGGFPGGCTSDDRGARPWGFGRGGFGEHRRSRGPYGVVHTLLERLEVSSAQERDILRVVDDVRQTVRDLKGDAGRAREDLARALREPTLDADAVASARGHVEAASHRIADSLTTALTEIHGILDERQRRMLGDVIASAWSSRW